MVLRRCLGLGTSNAAGQEEVTWSPIPDIAPRRGRGRELGRVPPACPVGFACMRRSVAPRWPARARARTASTVPGQGRKRTPVGLSCQASMCGFSFKGTFPMAFAPARGRSTFSAPANARSKRAHISRRCGQPYHVRYRGCSRARRKSCPTAKLSTAL